MKKIGLLCFFVLICSAIDVNGTLLKHLTPRPGGIIDSLTKHGQQLRSHLGGGISFGVGSLGFNLGFNKEYVPGGVIRPPKGPLVPEEETGYPDGNPYVPGVKPGYPEDNPYVPGGKPGYPDGNPYIPGPKPVIPQNPVVKPPKPSMTWEDEEDKIVSGYPSKDKDYSKPESYEKDYPKPGPYEDTGSPKREDKRPDWEDIGEVYEKDPKAENYMDSDLVGEGVIQPRKPKRNKRFIESKIYHVPLLFRSNAKPSKVKIHNSLNDLMKEGFEQ